MDLSVRSLMRNDMPSAASRTSVLANPLIFSVPIFPTAWRAAWESCKSVPTSHCGRYSSVAARTPSGRVRRVGGGVEKGEEDGEEEEAGRLLVMMLVLVLVESSPPVPRQQQQQQRRRVGWLGAVVRGRGRVLADRWRSKRHARTPRSVL